MRLVVRLVLQLVAVVAVAFLGGQGVAMANGNPWLTLGIGILTAVVSVLVYGWVVRRTEHRPYTEVAPKGAGAALGWGTLIGIVLFAAVILNIAFLGYYQVHGMGSVPSAIGLVGFMAAAAVTEEVMYRGVLFRIVEERTGTWIALLLTAVLFGLSHLLNPNASAWGAIAIAIEAGGMLAAAYVATRKLWLPIGLHFGWNFAESAIFSAQVSGNNTPQGLLNATMPGPAIITGGEFGPEASPYSVLFCVLATIVFLWVARRRGNLIPLRGHANLDSTATARLSR